MWIHPIYGRIEPAREPPISQTGDGLTMAEYAVETIGLGRRFGRIEALADVSLTVPTGELVGLIGPNGAGKTTLIMLLLGYWGRQERKALLGADATGEFSKVGSAVGVCWIMACMRALQRSRTYSSLASCLACQARLRARGPVNC